MTNFTITLTDEQVRDLRNLAISSRPERTIEEMLEKVVSDGLKDKLYRKGRNIRQWEQTKNLKATCRALEEKLAQLSTEE